MLPSINLTMAMQIKIISNELYYGICYRNPSKLIVACFLFRYSAFLHRDLLGETSVQKTSSNSIIIVIVDYNAHFH
jgi:hypothetical protein